MINQAKMSVLCYAKTAGMVVLGLILIKYLYRSLQVKVLALPHSYLLCITQDIDILIEQNRMNKWFSDDLFAVLLKSKWSLSV